MRKERKRNNFTYGKQEHSKTKSTQPLQILMQIKCQRGMKFIWKDKPPAARIRVQQRLLHTTAKRCSTASTTRSCGCREPCCCAEPRTQPCSHDGRLQGCTVAALGAQCPPLSCKPLQLSHVAAATHTFRSLK